MNHIRTAVFIVLVAGSGTGMAQTAPDPVQVRNWAAACANCHGTGGQAQPGNESLAGANREDMLKMLLDFKSGRKPATLMHQLAKGYSDQELTAIAGYFAALKK